MRDDLINSKEEVYKEAKKKSEEYLGIIYNILKDKTYEEKLKRDFNEWGKKHTKKIRSIECFTTKKIKTSKKEYRGYLKWLKNKGMLDNYLERSISYIFMRDLGKDINDIKNSEKIMETVNKIKESLDEKDFEGVDFYRRAKEEGLLSLISWILDKMKNIEKNIPDGIDKTNAMRKIIKIIAGVLMYRSYDDSKEKRDFESSVKIGYTYGLTYPFIDDILDAKILTMDEEREYSRLIKEAIITGVVPEKEWNTENKEVLNYIFIELKNGFNYIKENQKEENIESFLGLAYVFFEAQELDRKKDLREKYSIYNK